MKILNLNVYQIVIALISLGMIFLNSAKFIKREKSQTFIKFLLIVAVWTFILFFSIFPSYAHRVSEALGMGENLNTLIFLVFVVIFLILFKIINIIERIERNISDIVREEALKNLKKE